MLTPSDIQTYHKDGYFVAPALFAADEAAFFQAHYEAMRVQNFAEKGQSLAEVAQLSDPLLQYPRIMQMHRHDTASLNWLIDARINQHLTALLGAEPFAVQTMFYFKPAGARGQALHQDQFYLRVQPGTCMAAWMAVDDCDEENGCLRVVPGSHTWPLLCTTEADTRQSFTDVTVPLPEGMEAIPVCMKAGDVLFFNGQLVHGSLPNSSQKRFRRALIAHYIMGDAEKVYRSYHPVLRMDGTDVTFGESEQGGICGTWVDKDGEVQLEMQAEAAR